MNKINTTKEVEKAILNAADILKDNALALAHDIDSQKVTGISIWIRFDADSDSIPTLEIEKEYFLFDDVEKTKS